MWCNQQFSLIALDNEKYKIVNIIICDNYAVADMIAKESYGTTAIARDTTRIPVAIGDVYRNDKYYRVVDEVEVEIEPNPTEEEALREANKKIIALSNEIDDTNELLFEQEVRLSCLEIGIEPIE